MNIQKNIQQLRSDIDSRLSKASKKQVTMLCVVKNQPLALIEEAILAGELDFAENYVQEAIDKWSILKQKYPKVRLHLIGGLQNNKVKKALEIFDIIQTIDSVKLAEKIATTLAKELFINKSFFIQVNLDENSTSRSGVVIANLENLLNKCRELNLPINGLMAVAPINRPVAPYFALMASLNSKYDLPELSLGMSNDFMEAINFGSTMIRIGSKIFGERK